jgi:hypothetical protein
MAENTDRTQHISPNPATVAGSAPETSQSAPTAEVPAENTKTVESHRTSSGGSALETNGHTIGKTSPTAATPLAAASNDGSSDFKGEVETNNEIPSIQALRAIENYTVVDRNGKTHPFKSLYSGHNVARRVLIIFIRHFFCGVSDFP